MAATHRVSEINSSQEHIHDGRDSSQPGDFVRPKLDATSDVCG